MMAEFVALVEQPHLLLALIAALLFGGFAGMTFEQFRTRMRREKWLERNRSRWRKKRTSTDRDLGLRDREPAASRQPDAADQLRVVMGATFTVQPLLNRGEARLFKEVDRLVLDCNPEWQVMAQVSLGEVLRSRDADAYRCINSKRVDLLLMDPDCRPRHAIEYQGGGHHQGTAAARDAVKKEALRRAGIGYHEVLAGHTTPAELRHLVERLVDKPAAPESARGPQKSN